MDGEAISRNAKRSNTMKIRDRMNLKDACKGSSEKGLLTLESLMLDISTVYVSVPVNLPDNGNCERNLHLKEISSQSLNLKMITKFWGVQFRNCTGTH